MESRRSLREQFTLEDLTYHYLKYRHHIEGQTYLNTADNAEMRLVKALEKLPQIKTVEYASREVRSDHLITDQIPFTAIGRETLSEPCILSGFTHHAKQFIALLQAASQSCKSLTTIKGVRLGWETFDSPDQLRTMLGAVKNVQHLALTMSGLDRGDRRQKLARIIASAPDLKTLELCFGCLSFQIIEHMIELSQLLKYRVYWPILQRLVLQGFCTTENIFKMFLRLHAASLKSLELSNMSLSTPDYLDSAKFPYYNGSFLSLIEFLQSSLKLEHVEFYGTLCNYWDEGWVVSEYIDEEQCLKSHIKRFIVYGGDHCPLQAPDTRNKHDGWDTRGDKSWRHECRLLGSSLLCQHL